MNFEPLGEGLFIDTDERYLNEHLMYEWRLNENIKRDKLWTMSDRDLGHF